MDIVRNTDGTLLVPVLPERKHPADDAGSDATVGTAAETAQTETDPATRLLHPGEGGYDEALAEWDLEQNPDREPVVSTASGRQEAMTLVHAVAVSPEHAIAPAVEARLHARERRPRRAPASLLPGDRSRSTPPARDRGSAPDPTPPMPRRNHPRRDEARESSPRPGPARPRPRPRRRAGAPAEPARPRCRRRFERCSWRFSLHG